MKELLAGAKQGKQQPGRLSSPLTGAGMADVTIQVLQGLEAGAILRQLPTPITIGREEENLVQLNDERISRFHAKIQANDDHLILTDLQSTNGTRVNGHFTRMRTIQIGDQIALGRCLLVVGSPEDIAELAVEIKVPDLNDGMGDDAGEIADPFPFGPPGVPQGLTPKQAAEVATLLEYARTEVLTTLNQVMEDPGKGESESVHIPRSAWHRLKLLPPQLARSLNRLIDPGDESV